MAASTWYNSRVKENLRREILWVIQHGVNDPRLPSMITVPSIKLAPDTRNATVFVSVFGTEAEQKRALKILTHAAPFIQNSVAKKVKIKNFPKFYFKLDTSFDEVENINALLDQVKDDLDRPL